MEATGVYWKPIYNLLEGHFQLLVVNPQYIKALRGHKTDRKDAAWIADLLRLGMLKESFIPSKDQRELRELTRYRTRLVEERAREVNRLQKTLEDTTIKLGDVVSDVLGKAARLILEALVTGETDPRRLANFAVGRVRASQEQLERALTGNVSAHHRFMLGEHRHRRLRTWMLPSDGSVRKLPPVLQSLTLMPAERSRHYLGPKKRSHNPAKRANPRQFVQMSKPKSLARSVERFAVNPQHRGCQHPGMQTCSRPPPRLPVAEQKSHSVGTKPSSCL